MDQSKTAIVAGAVAVVAVGTVTPIVVHHLRANTSIFASTRELNDSDKARFVRLTGVTPAQVARTYLEACSSNDWPAAARYWPPRLLNRYPDLVERTFFSNNYGGLEVVSLGKPFKGRISLAGLPAGERKRLETQGANHDFDYPGVFVPCEIRLKHGSVKKSRLSIRCDNPEHRWYFDGGL